MSNDRFLIELCSRELERYVEMLFADLRRPDDLFFMPETPIIGGRFFANSTDGLMQRRVMAALHAAQQHNSSVPAAYCPLPIHEDAIERLEDSDDHRHNLMGLFGHSLRWQNWNERHPPFKAFCCGLMFDPLTSLEIREDDELLAEFPPKRLAGICDGWKRWRSEEDVAWDRGYGKLCAEYNVAVAAQDVDAYKRLYRDLTELNQGV